MSACVRCGAVTLLRRLKRLTVQRRGIVPLNRTLVSNRGPGMASMTLAYRFLQAPGYYDQPRRKDARLAAIDRAIATLEAEHA